MHQKWHLQSNVFTIIISRRAETTWNALIPNITRDVGDTKITKIISKVAIFVHLLLFLKCWRCSRRRPPHSRCISRRQAWRRRWWRRRRGRCGPQREGCAGLPSAPWSDSASLYEGVGACSIRYVIKPGNKKWPQNSNCPNCLKIRI